ncbi:diaminopropionate ammonia-lyase [Mycolicibacterium chlorophenolicum]|uniref:Diaminopropionate ammonia-lyase n=1 Tax=Mycolicibacterium chlorophenolicum TaxID=37916 RepID=A0A0J6WM95_9MYCO|nr:diaminopropionate ammonia-lyase [Mycolicibacterium chlorophenolicum]KMO82857.1 Diaminopropionate ammonia-lyase [Mycolicibacterium chlorophenolicum]
MTTVEIYTNPAARPAVPTAGFAPESRVPLETHKTLPGYAPTELRSCPGLAARLGVHTVLVKDESERLGLPSFKILGASWAALTTVQAAWGGETDGSLSVETVRASIGSTAGRGLVAATDGNHGRGIARVAALLGLEATILVPEGTSQARIDAIASEGAAVEVVDGTYDDAIAASARLADDDHLVVSDTSWEGYEAAPRAVVEGYSTMFFEIDDALAAQGLPQPDVLVLQAGVGAFAASGLRHFRDGRPQPPATVVAEPSTANCLMASARAGGLTLVPGPHRSSMAGLNCGMPSELVWTLLAAGTDVFVGIGDDYAEEAMRALADEGIVSGESGAAGLGALLALAERGTPEERSRAGLHADACVLIVNTEGATDPANYERVVGRSAADIASARDHLVVSNGADHRHH